MSVIQTKINPFYDEYQNKVGISLPIENIIFKTHTPAQNSSPGFVEPYLQDGKYIVSFRKDIFQFPENNYKAIIAHEFTHVFDTSLLLQEADFVKRRTVLTEYTEFHATIVSYMFFAEGLSTNDIVFMSEVNEYFTLDDYTSKMQLAYLLKMSDLLKQKEAFSSHTINSIKLGTEIVRTLMYYLGTEKYRQTLLSASSDLSKVKSLFRFNVKRIYDLLCEDCIDSEILSRIHNEGNIIASLQ